MISSLSVAPDIMFFLQRTLVLYLRDFTLQGFVPAPGLIELYENHC
jgi:hypothetical protein